MITIRQRWTLSTAVSSGAAVNAFGYGIEHTIYYAAGDGGSSGVVTLLSATSSGGLFAAVPGTSTTVSTNGANVVTFTGPLLWVKPFSSNVVGTLNVELIGTDGA